MAPCQDIVVLLVDDDATYRDGVASNLADDGHLVHQCASPTEVTDAQLHEAHVVVTDFHMADVNGITFADALHRVRSTLSILLVTAYWTVEVEAAVVVRPYVELERKPIDYHDLHARIHALAAAA
jgi:DNA-binding NtrC family response regulator